MKFLFLPVFLFAFLAHGSCVHPKNNSLQISFTLAGYRPGDLDQRCHNAVVGANAFGFSSVTFIPAKVFDGGHVIPDGTVDDLEVQRCLDEIWNSDLNLIYQPHLESLWLIHPQAPSVWRADFNFVPDSEYFKNAFGAFFVWLQKHSGEILQSNRTVDIVVASELEKSTTLYGAQWLKFVQDLRSRLTVLGLQDRVRLGYDPNWYPMPSLTSANCSDFRAFVGSLDFIAPSFYGDWSHMLSGDGVTPKGHVQVDDLKKTLMDRLSYYPASKCKVPEMLNRDFSIGEFGTGGDFQHAEQDRWDLMQTQDYLSKRRAVYSNVIDWAKNQTNKSSPYAINIWTGGLFDPVGILPAPMQKPDPAIAKMFLDYQSWRCN